MVTKDNFHLRSVQGTDIIEPWLMFFMLKQGVRGSRTTSPVYSIIVPVKERENED